MGNIATAHLQIRYHHRLLVHVRGVNDTVGYKKVAYLSYFFPSDPSFQLWRKKRPSVHTTYTKSSNIQRFELQAQFSLAIMQIYTLLLALFLATTALAVCPNGPYKQGSHCGQNCTGAQRCSRNGKNVVRTVISLSFHCRLLVFLWRYSFIMYYLLLTFCASVFGVRWRKRINHLDIQRLIILTNLR